MTKLEYGAIPHNSGENRNPMDRDSGGLNITKQALQTHPYAGGFALDDAPLDGYFTSPRGNQIFQ